MDYDGIFLPNFRGEPSPELGHQHYQHPNRTTDDYDDQVDNFPALVIYLSLLSLSYDPGLWRRFYTQENLLLSKSDYADPANSECFNALKGSLGATVRYLARYQEECCALPVNQVPELEKYFARCPGKPQSTEEMSLAAW